jgi:hypothetical protein
MCQIRESTIRQMGMSISYMLGLRVSTHMLAYICIHIVCITHLIYSVPVNDAKMMCTVCPTSYCAAHLPSDSKERGASLGLVEFMCSASMDKEGAAGKGRSSGRRGFMRRLLAILKRDGRPMYKIPTLGHQPLDLHKLYGEVIRLGGITQVLRSGSWAPIKKYTVILFCLFVD